MEFQNVLIGRRSIRRYKEMEVPLYLIGEILDVARYAPSSGNLQNWKVVMVTDLEKRQQIVEACLQHDWMVEAPVYLVICNEYKEVKEHYDKLGKLFSIQNCASFAYAITLAAYERGLGSCWVGLFDNEAVQRILEIPEDIDPEIILTLGYTDEIKEPSLREDPRYLTFFNRWGETFTEFPSHVKNFLSLSEIKKQIKKEKKNV